MNFKIGTHIVTTRLVYTHHGIFIGNNEVVHYSCFSKFGKKGKVVKTSLEEFALGGKVYEYRGTDFLHSKKYPNEVIVKRALERLNEDEYNVVFNNCEHFANWCTHGDHFSFQTSGLAERNIRKGRFTATGINFYDIINLFGKRRKK